MIGKLKGLVDSVDDDHAIVDVAGVGYVVFASSRTLSQLAPKEAAALIIETHVREDHIHLYGFMNVSERDWFRLLSSVQRVGSRLALTILGALSGQQLMQAILAKDTTAFSRISGVGPKLAERIVTELKDKAGKIGDSGSFIPVAVGGKAAKENSAIEDTVSALVHLGYGRSEAYAAAMRAAQSNADIGLDDLIKQSLKEIAA